MADQLDTRTMKTTWLVDGDPAIAILEMVAIASGRAITDLAPLARHVDVDALDTLLVDSPVPVKLSFTYEGFEIVITSDGGLNLEEL